MYEVVKVGVDAPSATTATTEDRFYFVVDKAINWDGSATAARSTSSSSLTDNGLNAVEADWLSKLGDSVTVSQLIGLQTIVKFDTSRHRWREAVCKVLGVECGGDGGAAALAALAPAPLGAGSRGGARGTGTPWIRRWKSRAPDVAAEVIAVYVGFVRDVVQARLARVCAEFGSSAMAGGLLFQREPSFRCHTPSPRPTGRPHTDADYGHQSAELNVWVPVTRASGANSLYAESAPGAGDYAAFDVDYGDAVFFWGNQCRHYTVANDSGAARVSIDCRVLPRALHDPDEKRKDGGCLLYTSPSPRD